MTEAASGSIASLVRVAMMTFPLWFVVSVNLAASLVPPVLMADAFWRAATEARRDEVRMAPGASWAMFWRRFLPVATARFAVGLAAGVVATLVGAMSLTEQFAGLYTFSSNWVLVFSAADSLAFALGGMIGVIPAGLLIGRFAPWSRGSRSYLRFLLAGSVGGFCVGFGAGIPLLMLLPQEWQTVECHRVLTGTGRVFLWNVRLLPWWSLLLCTIAAGAVVWWMAKHPAHFLVHWGGADER